MNNYEDWAQLVARKLKGEADVIAAIEKDELDDAAAAEAFVRSVLTPFLPENFGVGAGHIVDAFGNRSAYFDAIIYNRDFPRIGLRGIQSDYLYESVLAAFTVRAKYIRKTFFDSMDACASLATLSTNTDKTVLVRLAKKNGLKPGPNKTFVHQDPLHTTRFELIGCPPAFMFGFSGIKNSYRQLQENIELWIAQRQAQDITTTMRAFPAVIATQGCFAWRNAAPLALSNREMLGIGNDPAPIRLIVLQMLYLLNRRLHVTTDGYGMKPNLNAYMSQFKPPKFEVGVGDVNTLVSARQPEGAVKAGAPENFQPARDHSTRKAEAAPVAAVAAEQAAPRVVKSEAAPASAAVTAPESAPAPEAPANPEAAAGVFDKPSPFASAPAPTEAQPVEPAQPARKMPVAPLGSAPIPGMANPAAEAEPDAAPMPVPDLMPEPELISEPEVTPEPDAAPKTPVAPEKVAPEKSEPAQPAASAADVIPPKPPVDIEITGNTEVIQEPAAEPDYDATVVITPDAASMGGNQSQSSTEAFIARVKEQLASQENLPENDEDSFTSTIPQ